MIRKFFIISLILITICLSFLLISSQKTDPRSLVIVIGDGTGLPIISAYDYYKSEYKKEGYSSFKDFDSSFLVRTRSEDKVVTDSAAGATAFFKGQKVPNYQLGKLDSNKRTPTLLDIAQSKGKSTGIIVECSLTHATPAALYSYSPSRSNDEEIAQQLLYSNIDLLIGGGKKYLNPFLNNFKANNYTITQNEDELYNLIKTNSKPQKLLALTAEKHPPKYKERKISLKEKTRYALSLLSQNPNGFFLMVEASQVDWYGHDNKLQEQLDEMEDLDLLLSELIKYQSQNKNLLVVFLADHDCGGLTLIDYKAEKFSPEFKINYSSTYHTAEHTVGFYKGLIKVPPVIENTDIFYILKDYLN